VLSSCARALLPLLGRRGALGLRATCGEAPRASRMRMPSPFEALAGFDIHQAEASAAEAAHQAAFKDVLAMLKSNEGGHP
jgi:hypothetical protein